jgi:hypothetical protein
MLQTRKTERGSNLPKAIQLGSMELGCECRQPGLWQPGLWSDGSPCREGIFGLKPGFLGSSTPSGTDGRARPTLPPPASSSLWQPRPLGERVSLLAKVLSVVWEGSLTGLWNAIRLGRKQWAGGKPKIRWVEESEEGQPWGGGGPSWGQGIFFHLHI